jgi:WD40 repeat protein
MEDALFTADGRRVVGAAVNRSVRVWDAATGEQLRAFEVPGRRTRALALLAGNRLVTTDAQEPAARVWDLDTGTERRAFAHDAGVVSAAAMPDGKRFLTCGGRQPVRVWDGDTGDELERFETGADARGLAVTPDGKHFLVGGNDKSVRLWSFDKKAEVRRLALTTVPWRIGVSPDGAVVGVGNGNKLVLWDVRTFESRSLTGPAGNVDGVGFTTDGRHVFAAADAGLYFWDAATGKQVGRVVEHRGAVRDARPSPNGRAVVTTGVDGTAILWRLPAAMHPKAAAPKK